MLDAERYVGFLLRALPDLAATRLYPRHWPLPMGRYGVLDRALREFRRRPGVGLEFGVWRGASLRHMARRCSGRQFYGFDSFRGLPADGRPDWQIDFALEWPPPVPRNCRLVAGWFADTIPAFLAETRGPIGLVAIDCDVYSSARTALFGLGDRLLPGTVLYFDELINYDTFLWNEMRALFEFLEASGMGIAWLAAHARVRGLEEAFALYESGRYPAWAADVAAGYCRPAAAMLTAQSADTAERSPAEAARIAALAAQFERLSGRYEAMRPSAAAG
jgi:hypothetical protein